jgi:hypothetical protein
MIWVGQGCPDERIALSIFAAPPAYGLHAADVIGESLILARVRWPIGQELWSLFLLVYYCSEVRLTEGS